MSDGTPNTEPFEPLKPLEASLCEALQNASGSETRKISVSAPVGPSGQMRASFLRWFLLEAIPHAPFRIGGFELRTAEIEGALDLSGTEFKTSARFVSCNFRDRILLSDASVIALDLIGGEALGILADRISVSGTLAIRAVRPTDKLDLCTQTPGSFVVWNQIRLNGAKIRGNLDLRGCVLSARDKSIPLFADGLLVEGNVLLADRFKATGEVRLNGCRIMRNLDCSGAKLRNPRGYSLSAAGAEIAGAVHLSRTRAWPTYSGGTRFYSEGVLRLEGTKIHGDLDCTGGSFTAPAYVETASSQSDDEERGRQLDDQDKVKAIAADGVDVGNDLIFRDRFHARGAVSLIGAHVGGDLGCEGGFFDYPGEQALSADGISVSGTTFFADGARTNGTLCFTQASFKQGFYATGPIFDVSAISRSSPEGAQLPSRDRWELASEPTVPACGVDARSVTIEGPFRWLKIVKKGAGADATVPLWLYLSGSKADSVEDDEESWELLDRFDVTGCDYSDISSLTGEIHWRLRELDRQYAILNASGYVASAARALGRAFRRWLTGEVNEAGNLGRAVARFFPQPYIQFAKILRAAGYDGAANDVIVRLERNRTCYSDFSVLRQLGHWSLDLGLRYGFAPFRPVWILFVWALFSAACFEIAYSQNQIVPTKDNQEVYSSVAAGQSCKGTDGRARASTGTATTQACDDPRVTFNALIFAIDTLIPLVDLNQKKNWVVEPLSAASQGREQNAAVGWREILSREWRDRPDLGPGALVIFNTFFGWLMTTFFAAGITGLLRSGKDSA